MKPIKIITKHIKLIADVHTPVSIYNKLRDHFTNTLLLESADYHDRSDSKSFICIEAISNFEAKGLVLNYQFPNESEIRTKVDKAPEVLKTFKSYLSRFAPQTTNLPFNAQGLFGYSSFESVQYMEDIKLNNEVEELKDNPDLKYQLFRYVLVYDHFKSELYITENEINEAITSNDGILDILNLIKINNLPHFGFRAIEDETSSISEYEYKKLVSEGIAHCKLGDTFQLVLSRCFYQNFQGDDFNVYRSLRNINPSPYLFYFDYSDFKIFGSSPESQIQIKDRNASINPIAGTVLRGDNHEEDVARAKDLRLNPKEMAEHVMLVDLARNDLSKHTTKVKVDTFAETQFFSHVIHLVSKVSGELGSEENEIDVYAGSFPAGTLCGTPKYKALELIAEKEKRSRNFYGGSIGFIGFDGSINQAIIIRSVLSKNNTLCYQAGAGIVSDSTPEGELQEVYNKIAAIRNAIIKAREI